MPFIAVSLSLTLPTVLPKVLNPLSHQKLPSPLLISLSHLETIRMGCSKWAEEIGIALPEEGKCADVPFFQALREWCNCLGEAVDRWQPQQPGLLVSRMPWDALPDILLKMFPIHKVGSIGSWEVFASLKLWPCHNALAQWVRASPQFLCQVHRQRPGREQEGHIPEGEAGTPA